MVEVEDWATRLIEHRLIIQGMFFKCGVEFSLANVYATCDGEGRQILWDRLGTIMQNYGGGGPWCVVGNFNAIRHHLEKRSMIYVERYVEEVSLNKFIDVNALVDFTLCGRRFIWYHGDSRVMSRLDRFLVSTEWCVTWPNCTQWCLPRGLSDHYPLLLNVDVQNWGLRPQQILKCWANLLGYHDYAVEQWSSFQVEGWGGYVLKEKLRLINENLKLWHKQHTQNLEG
ncbi:uncharacterized protein LOC131641397 [Vicia villosa]|uniref:uncharacterized protein LOC131641397 n=1 Tax=Vicia villosa TaxID=3911 RepID=UPI00273AA00B|nr:uncharacterized protein LOC131641397 [Vicia villosa]